MIYIVPPLHVDQLVGIKYASNLPRLTALNVDIICRDGDRQCIHGEWSMLFRWWYNFFIWERDFTYLSPMFELFDPPNNTACGSDFIPSDEAIGYAMWVIPPPALVPNFSGWSDADVACLETNATLFANGWFRPPGLNVCHVSPLLGAGATSKTGRKVGWRWLLLRMYGRVHVHG